MFTPLIIIGLLLAGLVLVAHGTAVINRWGLNLDLIACLRCKAKVPQASNQALWGGWTCGDCGCEIDKMGPQRSIGDGALPLAALTSLNRGE